MIHESGTDLNQHLVDHDRITTPREDSNNMTLTESHRITGIIHVFSFWYRPVFNSSVSPSPHRESDQVWHVDARPQQQNGANSP